MKILAIGAHQDDNELRLGGTAKKWVMAGHEVRFLSLCNGSGGHHSMTPKQTTERRAKESAAVAEYLGIGYDVWDIDDCTLMPDLETRFRLIRYIREFSPDLIVSHRLNDYHADHRAAAQLVQDASFILTVPHTCQDTPAMRRMPVIVYNEDTFRNPDFDPTYLVDIDDVKDTKFYMCHLNDSQVYEWLPYVHELEVPENKEERFAWLCDTGLDEVNDTEILKSKSRRLAIRFAKTAARFRSELITQYGEERGSRIRYAEVFELCPYGAQPTSEFEREIFGL